MNTPYLKGLLMIFGGLLLAHTIQAQIYVTQSPASGSGRVLTYNLDGTSATALVTSGLSQNVYGLALDSSNNIYVSDYTGHAIREYTPSGTQLGTPPLINGGSLSPFAVSVSSSNIFAGWYSGSVTRYDSTGGSPTATAITGLGANTVIGLALDPTAAYLYVANYANGVAGSAKIGRYDIVNNTYNGSFISGLTKVSGITTDSSGNIYVSTLGNAGATDIITRYNSSGGSPTTFASGLDDPYGMATANGYLYVANGNAKTVGRYLLSDGSGSSSFITGLSSLPVGITVVSTVPEPSSVALLCIGGLAFASWKVRVALRKKSI